MTMLSLNQVEVKYGKKEPCERGYSWIIRFSHCLNFGYHKYFFFFLFSIRNQNGSTCCAYEENNL